MKKYFVLLGLLVLVVATICAQPDNLLYELRIYTAEKGKLNELHKRFRQHTLGLFEKHGITNVAYWTPIDNPDEKLYFVLSYPNLAARDAAWAAFQADTVWQRVKKQSEMRGGLVANAQSIYLKTTPYSPKDFKPNCPRVWELRIYTTPPGRLVYLNQRFRDHTMKLFKKHGMRNIIYWAPTKPEQGADTMLYYLLTHRSEAAAAVSFAEFGKDPKWQKVAKASEVAAGGPVISKLESVFLYPTDYSPLR